MVTAGQVVILKAQWSSELWKNIWSDESSSLAFNKGMSTCVAHKLKDLYRPWVPVSQYE